MSVCVWGGGGGLLFVGCLTSQQQASVSQGRVCSDNFTCCHTEVEAANQTFYLTQSQYTDTEPASPSADPITPGAWQGRHWSTNFSVTGMTRPGKIPSPAGFKPQIFRSRGGRLNQGGGREWDELGRSEFGRGGGEKGRGKGEVLFFCWVFFWGGGGWSLFFFFLFSFSFLFCFQAIHGLNQTKTADVATGIACS